MLLMFCIHTSGDSRQTRTSKLNGPSLSGAMPAMPGSRGLIRRLNCLPFTGLLKPATQEKVTQAISHIWQDTSRSTTGTGQLWNSCAHKSTALLSDLVCILLEMHLEVRKMQIVESSSEGAVSRTAPCERSASSDQGPQVRNFQNKSFQGRGVELRAYLDSAQEKQPNRNVYCYESITVPLLENP